MLPRRQPSPPQSPMVATPMPLTPAPPGSQAKLRRIAHGFARREVRSITIDALTSILPLPSEEAAMVAASELRQKRAAARSATLRQVPSACALLRKFHLHPTLRSQM